MLIKQLFAKDGSINYVLKYGKSFIEARYVRRKPSYMSVYVSSHNGCVMGCKFCWLTQQNQTQFKHVDLDYYRTQLDTVLSNVPDSQLERQNIRVNINFMARGEALANKNIVHNYPVIYDNFLRVAKNHGFGNINVNISTIMPHVIRNYNLFDIFDNTPVRLYYSLYSIDPQWKKQWMPNAMDYNIALDKLKEYQMKISHNLPITFHWAFIKGENDNPKNVLDLVNEVNKRRFKNVRFNLVRFNPGKLHHSEPDIKHLQYLFGLIDTNLENKFTNKQTDFNTNRIINRVGEDVFASCGMFIDDPNI